MDQASSQVIVCQAPDAPSGRSAKHGRTDVVPGGERRPRFEGDLVPGTATHLQDLIQAILEPVALAQRPVKEWRSLYRAFFAWFSSDGGAPQEDRTAWGIAFDAFNRNLVAVRDRATYVVPMTIQDFIDGVDAFKYDGLKENPQRDITWQPKKILLLMAAMIGRILAGRQADELVGTGAIGDLTPFREHLVEANRRASFLGHVFQHDPRFSILDYLAAGLMPLFHSYPHGAYALMENGLCRCEPFAARGTGLPPFLRLHFQRPLRVPILEQTFSHLDVVLLRDSPAPGVPSGDYDMGFSNLEFSSAPLAAVAFEPNEEWADKMRKIEQLFEWALDRRCLMCSAYRANQRSASVIGQALGRTSVDQFVIEQFFAHGFRSGSGNEPWHEPLQCARSDLYRDQVKLARKQFKQWRSSVSFFTGAGCPEAADIVGARLRHESLDPKGNCGSLFWALLQTPIYAPLMAVFLSADAQGGWVVKEQDLAMFTRVLNGEIGQLLLNCQGVIAQGAEDLAGLEAEGTFLFEYLLQTFLAMATGVKTRLRGTRIEAVRDTLRRLSEKAFTVNLTHAPSAWWEDLEQLEARVAAVKQKIPEAEGRIWDLLLEPLTREVAPFIREAIRVVTQAHDNLVALVAPRVTLQNQKDFEQSVANLGEWVKRRHKPASAPALTLEDQPLLQLAEVRILVEEGAVGRALDQAVALLGSLSKSQKTHLEPFFVALSRLLLEPLDENTSQPRKETVKAWAKQARLLLAGTPALVEFDRAFTQCGHAYSEAATAATRLAASFRSLPAPEQEDRANKADSLLRDFADELALDENLLEKEFLQATDSGAVFSRKQKLENRLRKLTRWGGREPHVSSLRLLVE